MKAKTTDDNRLITYHIKINPTFSTIFTKIDPRPPRTQTAIESDEFNLKQKKFNGFLSQNSKNKIKNIVNWLLQLSDEKKIEIDGKVITTKISFITLTLPARQQHTDEEIKKTLLNQFFVEMRKKNIDFLYLWKAEKQKNGNIHFHITSNAVMHYTELQNTWNRITEKLGYISSYRNNQNEKFKHGFFFNKEEFEKYGTNYEKQLERYWKGKAENWSNPHSTEIKSVFNVRNLAAYISEYIAKNTEDASNVVSGRLWGCSKMLENINCSIDLSDYEINFSKFKMKHKDFVCCVYATISDMLQTDLQSEIVMYFKNLIEKYKKNE